VRVGLTRFRGHPETFVRGVQYVQDPPRVRAGRVPGDLAREFEPTAQSTRNWVAQADRSEGHREEKSDAPSGVQREELIRLRREVRQLRLVRDILSKAAAWFATRPERYRPGLSVHEHEPGLVSGLRNGARARRLHRGLLRLATSPAVRSCAFGRGAAEADQDRPRHFASGLRSTAIHGQLRTDGEQHGPNRIARLMRAEGLLDACHRRGGPITTRRNQKARPAPDLVDRDFTAQGPNRLWVADITFVPTATGFLYLAVVLDAWSRKIVTG